MRRLDAVSIDSVRAGAVSPPLEADSRPRVAELMALRSVATPNGDSPRWAADFRTGLIGALVAAKTRGDPNPPSDSTLAVEWVNSQTRIFLSFARQDHATALLVQEALRAEGYSVFTYLNDTASPVYETEIVQRLFAEATHHLVIDTENARQSPGVRSELEAIVSRLRLPHFTVRATSEHGTLTGFKIRGARDIPIGAVIRPRSAGSQPIVVGAALGPRTRAGYCLAGNGHRSGIPASGSRYSWDGSEVAAPALVAYLRSAPHALATQQSVWQLVGSRYE